MNTQSNDNDRYETYVGMFGDVHLLDKKSLSTRIVLSTVKFGWFLVLLYIFVPIAFILLVILLHTGNNLFKGDSDTIIGLIIGSVIFVLMSFSKKGKK